MERHTVSRLIGAPPGYVGYDQGGLLTEEITKHPHAVLLLDEMGSNLDAAALLAVEIFIQNFLSTNNHFRRMTDTVRKTVFAGQFLPSVV